MKNLCINYLRQFAARLSFFALEIKSLLHVPKKFSNDMIISPILEFLVFSLLPDKVCKDIYTSQTSGVVQLPSNVTATKSFYHERNTSTHKLSIEDLNHHHYMERLGF